MIELGKTPIAYAVLTMPAFSAHGARNDATNGIAPQATPKAAKA